MSTAKQRRAREKSARERDKRKKQPRGPEGSSNANDPFRPAMKRDRLVQYVVGLCCVRNDPSAVSVMLGDMVHDQDAGERRDVDVTVLVPEADGQLRGLLAFEAKDEGRPLDVTTIEQLWAKLQDMPSVAHKSIVSTSGYTKPAVSKGNGKGNHAVHGRTVAYADSDLGCAFAVDGVGFPSPDRDR